MPSLNPFGRRPPPIPAPCRSVRFRPTNVAVRGAGGWGLLGTLVLLLTTSLPNDNIVDVMDRIAPNVRGPNCH